MKRTFILCLLGLVLLGNAVWSQTNKNDEAEQAVVALEKTWLQSQKTNNPDLLPPLLADNFVGIGSDGKVADKAETIATAKSVKWRSAEYSDVRVRVFGDTAIMDGVFKGKGTGGLGKPLDLNVRWADTWVKMSNGQWQCVTSQDTPVKM
jgi:hypothetical protein